MSLDERANQKRVENINIEGNQHTVSQLNILILYLVLKHKCKT